MSPFFVSSGQCHPKRFMMGTGEPQLSRLVSTCVYMSEEGGVVVCVHPAFSCCEGVFSFFTHHRCLVGNVYGM